MNTMTQAFVAKGVVPLSKTAQIWRWVKDNKDHSTKEICTALSFKLTTGGALLTQMCDRKMMERHDMEKFGRATTVYSTPADMPEYVSLPISAATKAARKPTRKGSKSQMAQRSGPVSIVTAKSVPLNAPMVRAVSPIQVSAGEPVIIDRLAHDGWSFADVRKLYKALHKLFGDRA